MLSLARLGGQEGWCAMGAYGRAVPEQGMPRSVHRPNPRGPDVFEAVGR
ncbi:hypothetical protein ACQUSR_10550 [Streptomyces sp. P1-3]